ncbi:MAG: metallophosphoesterase, partial [Propionibacteriaceae bacterium]|nr:metallophosphoesterase [Propionibacteriaceae bacterium]
MAQRFSLETANIVGNLTFGKVLSCYRDIYTSPVSYVEFVDFLDGFQTKTRSKDAKRYARSLRQVRATRDRMDIRERLAAPAAVEGEEGLPQVHSDTVEALHELSEVLDRCAVKSLMLPGLAGGATPFDDRFLTGSKALEQLIGTPASDRWLIMQPQVSGRSVTILDAFPHFEVALRQADLWPAVFFWTSDEDFAFVPVRQESELRRAYETVQERPSSGGLTLLTEGLARKNHYLFQLSDLHFGAKGVDVVQKRLRSLVNTQLASFEPEDCVGFVVTGDVVDSPKRSYEADYREFEDFLEQGSGHAPIRVLGNHDVNNHGLASWCRRRKIANLMSEFPKIETLEEHKTILLLFNSNTNGRFAEGEIGQAQMAQMDAILDCVDNLADYLLIAVLHHHVLPIPHPDNYQDEWFRKILPEGFLDEFMKLIDAGAFLGWLKHWKIPMVIHGHMHIPFIAEHSGITVMACGSSTGQIRHKER